MKRVIIVFTDLDGTLLDHDTYSFEEARPALAALAELGIPCIPVTSKTRAEMEPLRELLGNRDPFVVENGGAIFVPGKDGVLDTIGCGVRYEVLIAALERASAESGCRVRGFHRMSDDEVAAACGLTLEQARLAKQRQSDEPFLILDRGKEGDLFAAIERRGLSCTRGGRFHHIFGGNDKGRAVETLTAMYRREHGTTWTIGLGDSSNDTPFLDITDVAVVVRAVHGRSMRLRRSGAIVTEHAGPRGWNEAILALLRQYSFHASATSS